MVVKYCSCGMPQSFPIPHEHDRTDREKQIIAHFEKIGGRLMLKWENIIGDEFASTFAFGGKTERLEVFGGWLVRTIEGNQSNLSITFVPDPEHCWHLPEDAPSTDPPLTVTQVRQVHGK